jgi:hypothetical protein
MYVGRSEPPRLHGLGVYFGVPLVLGFAVGIHQGGFGRYFSVWGSLVVWEVHFLIFWACCLGAAALLSAIPRYRLLPLLPRLISSAVLGALISRPIFWVTYQLRTAYAMQAGASPEAVARPIRVFEFSGEFALMLLQLYGPNIVLWTVCCWTLSKLVPIPVLTWSDGGDVPMKVAEAAAFRRSDNDIGPGWISRLKPEIGRKLCWLKAEGHYVRVRTTLGTDLIHYRLSDAVEQLASLGLQVHRSYWISYEALRAPATRIESGAIQLDTGETIPIGPTYLVKVREAREIALASANAS